MVFFGGSLTTGPVVAPSENGSMHEGYFQEDGTFIETPINEDKFHEGTIDSEGYFIKEVK